MLEPGEVPISYRLILICFSLAQSIWETGNEAKNPSEFTSALANSDLQEFGFTEAFTFDLWGAISDAKQGRLKNAKEFDEAF